MIFQKYHADPSFRQTMFQAQYKSRSYCSPGKQLGDSVCHSEDGIPFCSHLGDPPPLFPLSFGPRKGHQHFTSVCEYVPCPKHAPSLFNPQNILRRQESFSHFRWATARIIKLSLAQRFKSGFVWLQTLLSLLPLLIFPTATLFPGNYPWDSSMIKLSLPWRKSKFS